MDGKCNWNGDVTETWMNWIKINSQCKKKISKSLGIDSITKSKILDIMKSECSKGIPGKGPVKFKWIPTHLKLQFPNKSHFLNGHVEEFYLNPSRSFNGSLQENRKGRAQKRRVENQEDKGLRKKKIAHIIELEESLKGLALPYSKTFESKLLEEINKLHKEREEEIKKGKALKKRLKDEDKRQKFLQKFKRICWNLQEDRSDERRLAEMLKYFDVNSLDNVVLLYNGKYKRGSESTISMEATFTLSLLSDDIKLELDATMIFTPEKENFIRFVQKGITESQMNRLMESETNGSSD